MASGKGAGIAESTSFALLWVSFPPFQRLGKIQNPKPQSLNAKPKILNPKPKILNPKPKILNAKRPPAPVNLAKPGGLGNGLRKRSRHCKIDKLYAFVGFPPSCQRLAVAGSGSPMPKFNPEPFATQKRKSKTQKPKAKTPNPKSKTQTPKSKTQKPKPNIQDPKTKILNVKQPARAGNLTTFKGSRPLLSAGDSGRQLGTSTLN